MAATTRPLRLLSRSSLSVSPARRSLTTIIGRSPKPSTQPTRHLPAAIYHPTRSFSCTITPRKGIQPQSSDPAPPNTEPQVSSSTTEPTPLSEDAYHEKADSYLDRLVLALEEKAESNPDFEIEYDVRHVPSMPHSLLLKPLPLSPPPLFSQPQTPLTSPPDPS